MATEILTTAVDVTDGSFDGDDLLVEKGVILSGGLAPGIKVVPMNGGSLTVKGMVEGGFMQGVLLEATSVVMGVTKSGSITSLTSPGVEITGAGGFNALTNSGTISGSEGVRLTTHNSSFLNRGVVKTFDPDAAAVHLGNGADFTNSGRVRGGDYGVDVVDAGTVVTNLSSGKISGQYGLQFQSPGELFNEGTVFGKVYGVASFGGALTLENAGLIEGTGIGVVAIAGLTLTNTGVIKGEGDWAIKSISLAYIDNSGKIEGDVELSAGNDTLFNQNNGVVKGWVIADAGNDQLVGGDKKDRFDGGEGSDSVSGGDGNDLLRGGEDGDTIEGGNGKDTIFGDEGGDTIFGDGDADKIRGGDGIDVLLGGDGKDWINGGGGEDEINGGTGNDVLIGGLAGDRFVFADNKFGKDRIVDFRDGEDMLDLSFYGLTAQSVQELLALGRVDRGDDIILKLGILPGVSGKIILQDYVGIFDTSDIII